MWYFIIAMIVLFLYTILALDVLRSKIQDEDYLGDDDEKTIVIIFVMCVIVIGALFWPISCTMYLAYLIWAKWFKGAQS